MATVIDSLLVALGFQVDPSGVEEFQKRLEDTRNTVLEVGKTVGLALAGITAGLTAFTVTQFNALDALGDFADANGLAASEVSTLQNAAELAGSSVEAMNFSIEGLNRTLGEAALGIGRGAKTFADLGLSAKDAQGRVKSLDVFLADLADKFEGLSRQEQVAIAQKLGVDSSLVPMLSRGRRAVEEYIATAREFAIPDSATQSVAILGEQVDTLTASLRFFSAVAGARIVSAVTPVITSFAKWVRTNKELIEQNINKVVDALTLVLGSVYNAIRAVTGALSSFVDWVKESATATRVFYVALLAVASVGLGKAIQNTSVLLTGFVQATLKAANALIFLRGGALLVSGGIGLVAGAIALLIDDYRTWKEGGESVIGSLVERFPALLDVITTLENATDRFINFWIEQWEVLREPVGELGESIGELLGVIGDLLWPIVETAFKGWSMLLPLILPLLVDIAKFIVDSLVFAIRLIIEVVSEVVDAFTWFFGIVSQGIEFVSTAFTGFYDSLVGGTTELIENIVAAFEFLFELFETAGRLMLAPFEFTFNAIEAGLKFITDALEAVWGKLAAVGDAVSNTVGWIGDKLGLTDDEPVDEGVQSVARAANAAFDTSTGEVTEFGAAGRFPRSGVLGAPAMALANGPVNNASTVNLTTEVGGITVVSPDPVMAGESVRRELDRRNQHAIRNGQSAVVL